MSAALVKRLSALRISSLAKGYFVADAAAAQLIETPTSIDAQINLIGALHEVGQLKNSLTPYWKLFRTDEAAWAQRCIARLLKGDHDYWAVAALLGCKAKAAIAQAKKLGFVVVAVRAYDRWDLPNVHVASMAIPSVPADSTILAPFLELGWDIKTEELVDCMRARAVLLDEAPETVKGSIVATGSMSYVLRCELPYGSWRAMQLPFVIEASSIVPGASPNPKFKT
jgi:hypothetical protein